MTAKPLIWASFFFLHKKLILYFFFESDYIILIKNIIHLEKLRKNGDSTLLNKLLEPWLTDEKKKKKRLSFFR